MVRLLLLPALCLIALGRTLAADPRQEHLLNILWITAEDMSPTLGAYGDAYATTPNLDRLARESVRYTRAFATAPVCSPARSCLITGMYATSLGTQHLRSLFPIPEGIKGFPAWLRAAGYHCTNNVKTDYNTAGEPALIASSWDASSAQAHWRGRKPGQPFFSVFNIMDTHQSRASVWPWDKFERTIGARLKPGERHDPARAPLPPYYPDTPTARRTVARYYDCVTSMDREVGRILRELEEDGLAGTTVVFFFSDHGMGLPRGKRTLYDSGLRVPLLLRFPKAFERLAPAAPGAAIDRLVSFVDFAPTVLSLAGLPVPDPFQGHAFLGRSAGPPREHVYGARDRVDEAYDLSRSVRGARWLYIRNYLHHLSWNQPEGYSDAADLRREITRLAAEGRLDAAQMAYAGPRPPEELYDTEADPHQVRNLADAAEHVSVLRSMRRLHRSWVVDTRDLGFLPESVVWERAGQATPWEMARDPERYALARIVEAAGSPGLVDAARLLNDPDPGVRYWAVMGLRASGEAGRAHLERALKDRSAAVRIEAAGALGEIVPLGRELKGSGADAVLHAARTLQLLGARARPVLGIMKEVLADARRREDEGPQYLFIRFALEAAVRDHEP